VITFVDSGLVIHGCNDLSAFLAEGPAVVLDGSSHSIDVGDTVVVLLIAVVKQKDIRTSLDKTGLVDLIEEGMIELVNQNVDVKCRGKFLDIRLVGGMKHGHSCKHTNPTCLVLLLLYVLVLLFVLF
jgi:hypothetical protein